MAAFALSPGRKGLSKKDSSKSFPAKKSSEQIDLDWIDLSTLRQYQWLSKWYLLITVLLHKINGIAFR